MQNVSIEAVSVAIGIMLGFGITAFSMFVGAYLAHRCFRIGAGSSENLFGQVPRGEVFSVQGPEEAGGDAPEDEKRILEKTNNFLKMLGGKGI